MVSSARCEAMNDDQNSRPTRRMLHSRRCCRPYLPSRPRCQENRSPRRSLLLISQSRRSVHYHAAFSVVVSRLLEIVVQPRSGRAETWQCSLITHLPGSISVRVAQHRFSPATRESLFESRNAMAEIQRGALASQGHAAPREHREETRLTPRISRLLYTLESLEP